MIECLVCADEQNSIPNIFCRSNLNWPTFDWLIEDLFPTILQLARMLPPREESLRTRLCKVIRSAIELKVSNTIISLCKQSLISVFISS